MRVVIALFATCLACSAALAADDERFAALDQKAREAVAGGGAPSLAVAVVEEGRIVYERAYGRADLASGRAATVHTAYALASATKPITATAVLQLAERGRIDLDAPARRYLGRLRLDNAAGGGQPRVFQLLGHSAGLGTYAQIHYGDSIAAAPPFARSVARFGVLVQPPGRVAEYSNLGYGLLGALVERRSGLSLADYLEREVFAPLGMDDSFVDAPSAPDADVAVGYDANDQALPALYNDTPGAGNVHASAHDLIRFARFHLDPSTVSTPVLRAESVVRMQRKADPAALQHYYGNSYYGLGWYVRENDGGERVVWHEGGMPGASSIIKLLPEHRSGVVVLANKTEVNAITQAIADEALRALRPGYAPGALDAVANYQPYAAQPEFLGEWHGELHVDGRRLRCTLRFGADGKVQIEYVGKDRRTVTGTLGGIVYGDSFVGAVPLALPVAEQRDAASPLLLLKLVRSGEVLQGALVAYASPARLDYLLPFYVKLRRNR